jgi:hypothetical protein
VSAAAPAPGAATTPAAATASATAATSATLRIGDTGNTRKGKRRDECKH